MRTVFVDVDTQLDFALPAGALYVPGAERILPHVTKLNRWAEAHGIPVISTTDAHGENDAEFKTWPAHCVLGTLGQRKPESTLLAKRYVLPSQVSAFDVEGVQQFIVQKQVLDCFSNENLQHLLTNLQAERYVVYGVVTEYCVRCAALGLLKTGAQVEVVTDAIETLKKEDGVRTLTEIRAAGGKCATVAEICG